MVQAKKGFYMESFRFFRGGSGSGLWRGRFRGAKVGGFLRGRGIFWHIRSGVRKGSRRGITFLRGFSRGMGESFQEPISCDGN
jgi:hypothetical protein